MDINEENPHTTDRIMEYLEEGYVSHNTHMPTDTYGEMLDSIVFTCVDVLVVCDSKLFIALRTRNPIADWWVFGGRMRTGETVRGSASRLVKEEMGINIEVGRFDYLTTVMVAWKIRAHKPYDHGTHNTSLMHVLKLSTEELGLVVLNDEYYESKLVNVNEIIENDAYHPALQHCASLLKEAHLLN